MPKICLEVASLVLGQENLETPYEKAYELELSSVTVQLEVSIPVRYTDREATCFDEAHGHIVDAGRWVQGWLPSRRRRWQCLQASEHLKQLQYYTMAHFQVGPWLPREFPSRERFPNRPTVAGVFASRTFCPESANPLRDRRRSAATTP